MAVNSLCFLYILVHFKYIYQYLSKRIYKELMDVGLDVILADLPELVVELYGHLVRAHVLHGLVQLLQTRLDGPAQVDGLHRLLQLLPCLLLEVLRQLGLLCQNWNYTKLNKLWLWKLNCANKVIATKSTSDLDLGTQTCQAIGIICTLTCTKMHQWQLVLVPSLNSING